jgi:hypothetical protein
MIENHSSSEKKIGAMAHNRGQKLKVKYLVESNVNLKRLCAMNRRYRWVRFMKKTRKSHATVPLIMKEMYTKKKANDHDPQQLYIISV